MLTYRNAADAEADRAQQHALLHAIQGQHRALRRDECGAWRINGKNGHIVTWGDAGRSAWLVYVVCHSSRAWEAAKRRLLSSCQVTQDGDEEGVLKLTGLPTPAQAKVLRDVLGIRKQREYDAPTRERLRASAGRALAARELDQKGEAAPSSGKRDRLLKAVQP